MRDARTLKLMDGETVRLTPTVSGYMTSMGGRVVLFKKRRGGWYALVQGDRFRRLESKTLLGGVYRAIDRIKETAA